MFSPLDVLSDLSVVNLIKMMSMVIVIHLCSVLSLTPPMGPRHGGPDQRGEVGLLRSQFLFR